jgi:hypothetical protein
VSVATLSLIRAALVAGISLLTPVSAAQKPMKPPPEMRAELELSTPAGHFEMREYPVASKTILKSPSRVSADVQIETANRDPQFASTVGFWVFDEKWTHAIRLMLRDDQKSGKLFGNVDEIQSSKSIELAGFKLASSAHDKVRVEISRPTSYEVAYTVNGKTRTFKVDFDPAHVVFQTVGVDGSVKFLPSPIS